MEATALAAFLIAAGPAVGSFLMLQADRGPSGWRGDALWGRSRCDHCAGRLGPWRLIPIVSWLAQRGRSRCCSRPLRATYPLSELFGAAPPAVALLLGVGPVLLVALTLLGWAALAIALSASRVSAARRSSEPPGPARE